MTIWSAEIKELEKLYDFLKGQSADLEKELGQLLKSDDPNVILLYSRRCLEVIITDLCEKELKRPRKTEPLKGIIDKLNKEEKVPSHIITSMDGLNSLSTFGTHPKEFDPEQVKPVLNNLSIVIKWYLKYKDSSAISKGKAQGEKLESQSPETSVKILHKPKKRQILFASGFFLVVIFTALILFDVIHIGKKAKGLAKLEKSVAVLPFKNDSPDEENVYFINGIMEEVLTNLQTIKDLRVISRTSTEQYRNQSKSIPEIAKELGVNYIVEGSGQKYGNTFRLRVQLIVAAEEGHLWADSYEQEISDVKDIFRIQSQIAQSIASALKAAITPQEKLLIEKIPTSDLTAYDAYLQGQFYWRKLTKIDLETAMMYFEKAKEIDPGYSLAYAGICDVWIGLQQMGAVRTSEAGPKIKKAIMKALELDSNRAEVQYTLALMKTWTIWDWKAGESAFKKAIEINPNHAGAHAYYSHLLNMLGRPEEAMKQIEIALKLDPLNSLIKAIYGMDLFWLRRYDDAVKAFQESIDIDPTQPVAYNIIRALFFLGKDEEAMEIWRNRLKNPEQLKAVNEGYAEGGFRGAHKKLADIFAEQSKTTDIRPYTVAHHYAMAGDIENAIFWLEKTYEDHDPNLPYLLDPKYDKIRDDPRFQDLARRMNLPYK